MQLRNTPSDKHDQYFPTYQYDPKLQCKIPSIQHLIKIYHNYQNTGYELLLVFSIAIAFVVVSTFSYFTDPFPQETAAELYLGFLLETFVHRT